MKKEKKMCMNNCGKGCFDKERLICDCICHKKTTEKWVRQEIDEILRIYLARTIAVNQFALREKLLNLISEIVKNTREEEISDIDKCAFCDKKIETGQTATKRYYHPHCDPKIGVLNPTSQLTIKN